MNVESITTVFDEIHIALEEAKIEANKFLDAPIWEHKDAEHIRARFRWFEHGEREALLAGLYLTIHGMPETVRTDATLSDIMLGFILHDIGKVESAPTHVWDLPSHRLRDEDRQSMRRHVSKGNEIIARYERWSGQAVPAVVLDILMYHHEKMDGSGKPNQLSGRDLGFLSRLAICIDQIVGRCEDRPYHEHRFSLREAYEDVWKTAGAQYDEQILRGLQDLFASNAHVSVDGCRWLGTWDDEH